MKNIQKKISLTVMVCLAFSMAFAQTIKAVDNKGTIVDIVSSPWLTKEGGTAIYNKNTGNVVIGNGTAPGTVNPNAALQFTEINKGILIPKVSLTATNNSFPFSSLNTDTDNNGLLVYNTATAGTAPNNVIPGFYYWDATAWKAITNPAGVTTVGAISATATTNGATITGNTLNLAPADATNGGVVTTGTQTFGGAKTFNSDITVNGITVGRGTLSSEFNTVLGFEALQSNTSNVNTSTAIGYKALKFNTAGLHNSAIGFEALRNNTGGDNNTAVGGASLFNNLKADNNTAIGGYSLFNNNGDNATENVAVGFQTLFSNNSGQKNTGLGVLALAYSQSGINNTAVGHSALASNTTGSANTALGFNANVGANNLTNATAIGNGAVVANSNTIQLGNTSVENVITSGKLKTGAVTYPNAHNSFNGQVLTTNASGVASWANPSGVTTFSAGTTGFTPATATSGAVTLGGTLNIANGGTGSTTKNFVDLTTNQTIAGDKTFSNVIKAGTVTYPNAHNSINGQVLTTNASGVAAWAAPSGVTAVGAISGTATANGASITGSTLNLAPANATNGGVVTTGTQTFEGNKQFAKAATNSVAYNAGTATTIDFTQSNLAYTSNSPTSFTLSGIKDGGTYTLAVQGTSSGTATFTSAGFTFKSVNNGTTTPGKETLYTFIVMGATVYFFMSNGF